MACAVEWLERAKTDLRAILDFIARDRPNAALAYIDEITARVGQLADFPESGRRYNRNYRVLVVHNHLIFYRHLARESRVLVVAVVDGRRDLAKVAETLK